VTIIQEMLSNTSVYEANWKCGGHAVQVEVQQNIFRMISLLEAA